MSDVHASEQAVALAEANGIDISTVVGTGHEGMVVVDDVKALIPQHQAQVVEEADTPIWPQGDDYNPREDFGPTRPEDEPESTE